MTRRKIPDLMSTADDLWAALLKTADSGNIELKDKIMLLDRFTRYMAVKNKIDPDEEGENGFERIRQALDSKTGSDRGAGNGARSGLPALRRTYNRIRRTAAKTSPDQ